MNAGMVEPPVSIYCADPALLPWLCKIHFQLMIIQGIGIEHADCLVGFALRAHGYEGKTLGLASFAVHDDINRSDFPRLCKERVQFLL